MTEPLRASSNRTGPVDVRLIRRARATAWFLAAGVAIGCATAVLVVWQASLLSTSVAHIFATADLSGLTTTIGLLAVVISGRAGLVWLHELVAHRAAAAVKSKLRSDILTARLRRPLGAKTSGGELITLVTQGLDALDGYFSSYLPQLALAVTVPLIVGVTVLTADLTSAIVMAVTLPLIPIFMVLVGWTTAERQNRRWRFQSRLAQHFADLVAGLPTLQVFGRARAQAEGLRRTEEANRRETLGTLRIAFLSALVLELLATLSVAVVAVTIGLRVVSGDLDLQTALFVLVLAPEVYLPVRQVGVHYHDAADGVAAAEAAFTLIEQGEGEGGTRPAPDLSTAEITIEGLGHTYPDARTPALAGLDLTISPGEIVGLAGPSGAGKSTALNALAGFVIPTEGRILVDGTDVGSLEPRSWRRQLALVPQQPELLGGSVGENVRLGFPSATDEQVRAALTRAGAAELELAQPVGRDGEGLSAGQRRRVGLARALLRIEHGGARLLLLDEPTAGLDSDSEAAAVAGLRASGAGALVVSHRPAVLAGADRVVHLVPPPASRAPQREADAMNETGAMNEPGATNEPEATTETVSAP